VLSYEVCSSRKKQLSFVLSLFIGVRNATSCRRRLNTAAAPVALGLPQLQPRLAALPLSFLVTSVADTATTEASLLHRSFFLPSSSCWWYSNSHVHSPIKELARVWDAKTHHANIIVPPGSRKPNTSHINKTLHLPLRCPLPRTKTPPHSPRQPPVHSGSSSVHLRHCRHLDQGDLVEAIVKWINHIADLTLEIEILINL
jgi:hypothetical protein